MASIGSVFLGDIQRIRNLSSTPPSTPTLSRRRSSSSLSHVDPLSLKLSPSSHTNTMEQVMTAVANTPLPTTTIDPNLALELRIRWLEAIILGVKQDGWVKDRRGKERELAKVQDTKLKPGQTLIRLAEEVQQKLNSVVEGNEGLTNFMEHYDQYAHLITLSSLPGTEAPATSMTDEEFDALLSEMEPDIRAAEKDMREIEALEKKNITGAGKLTSYENLVPRLNELVKMHKENSKLVESLEQQIALLVDRHTIQVDALSELFVAWDDTLTEVEDMVMRLERQRDERRRLGYEP